ncbi:hypothetical protein BD410DRAFT_779643 [Rickenella mellea]|uniref:Uncharacterized protein n=1 Tax=Rickenella mellea TaxID=50990 RepID=A0A4R5XEW3_9AGAM|nr:hypothetical protein BD410DRAFT_779643 [Rickenella mellea]
MALVSESHISHGFHVRFSDENSSALNGFNVHFGNLNGKGAGRSKRRLCEILKIRTVQSLCVFRILHRRKRHGNFQAQISNRYLFHVLNIPIAGHGGSRRKTDFLPFQRFNSTSYRISLADFLLFIRQRGSREKNKFPCSPRDAFYRDCPRQLYCFTLSMGVKYFIVSYFTAAPSMRFVCTTSSAPDIKEMLSR